MTSFAAKDANDSTVDVAVSKTPDNREVLLVQLAVGADGSVAVVDGASPLPVQGSLSVSNFPAVQQVGDNAGSLTVDAPSLGAPADAEATADGSIVAVLKRLRTLLAAGLPTTLTGSGNLKAAIVEATATVPVSDGGGSLTVDGAVAVSAALPAGGNLIGQVDVNNFPASSDTTDAISAAVQVGKVMSGLGEVTPQRAFANMAAGTTDGAVVALQAGKSLLVLAAVIVAGGTATTVTFNSKGAGAGTAISPLLANAANGGAVLPFNPAGWFKTNVGEALTATTGAGSTTGILIVYAAV